MTLICRRVLRSACLFATVATTTMAGPNAAPTGVGDATARIATPPAAAPKVQRKPPARINRPWDLRYFLYVTEHWSSAKRSALKLAAKAKDESSLRSWEEVVDPTHFFQFRDQQRTVLDNGLTIVVIEFGRDGRVITPTTFEKPLYGRLDRHQGLSLAHEENGRLTQFHLAYWFTGLGDASAHWAPGVCELGQMREPFSETNEFYLYGPVFEPSPAHPTMGCREWAYQLYDPDRPYIDVTSYIPKEFEFFSDGPGAYVKPVVGWAGFNHAPKPIIGNNEGSWFCLHECPKGEAPGPIPDIQAWAARHGWPAPERPERIPMFPDPKPSVGDEDDPLGEGAASDDPADTPEDKE